MSTTNEKMKAYLEAKQECTTYKNFKGDKRSATYKRIQNNVMILWMSRMNGFANQLGLPNYSETFYPSIYPSNN